ncbi:hypothetical protein [Bifidobacterium sp. SO4]|uniref:hypothetical protein n=1 Tax=Bifidobacterium sp. SO4 TaxID=2809030 RepID=UPI001BDCF89B|nr:hypothetical protein [Bifidobacterium sp. SO4]MBT1169994.1 hypothetical protein [Bifidobacterium sp. SO4]
MKQHKAVTAAITQAENEQQCAVGTTDSIRRALRRRYLNNELLSPYSNLYARPDYWQTLNECQRSMHVARALSVLHPKWVFAGLTAADAYGYDHSWNLHRRRMFVADTTGRHSRSVQGTASTDADAYRIEHVFMMSVNARLQSGILVTEPARTLTDCAVSLSFAQALPIFDSAARQHMDLQLVADACKRRRVDIAPIRNLLHYVDGSSENGGESQVRAYIIINGFATPLLQVEVNDPLFPARRYRTDFMWRLHDGRVIVLEYDGMAKYADASMTGRRTVKQILREQKERDRALRAAGVTCILHCTYEDTLSNKLFHMLKDAGVPQIRQYGDYGT